MCFIRLSCSLTDVDQLSGDGVPQFTAINVVEENGDVSFAQPAGEQVVIHHTTIHLKTAQKGCFRGIFRFLFAVHFCSPSTPSGVHP